MKNLLVIICFLMSIATFAQTQDTVIAAKIVTHMALEQFDSIPDYFDETMQDKFPAMMIESKWHAVLNSTGPFQKILHLTRTESDTLQAVLVTCMFEKANLDVKLVFDKQNKICGFWVRQASFDPNYKIPDYARPDSTKETVMTIPSNKPALPAVFTAKKKAENQPVIVFVHGSGPNDKDESLGGSKLFKDLAIGLAANGIATLRFDKRTLAYPEYFSKLQHPTVQDEVISDVIDAVKLVKKLEGVDTNKVYVLGHSLGAQMAPRIAEQLPSLAGIIMLAAPARAMEVLLAEQINYIDSIEGITKPDEATCELLNQVKFLSKKKYSLSSHDSLFPFNIPASYWIDLSKYNALKTASALSCRMFFLQGESDYQVRMTDFNLWKKELAAKKNVQFKSYPKMNHAFMEVPSAGLSTPEDYKQKSNAPAILIQDIASWVYDR